MRWTTERLPNIKTTMDRYGVLGRMINRNREKINAAGSPCTYWRNQSITSMGQSPTNVQKCYCWTEPTGTITGGDSQQSSPDKTHFLCHGTGYIPGYQKYGYTEIAVSTPSVFTKSSNDLVISGTRGSTYILSGASTSASLTTERFTLTNFLDVDYFLINEDINADQNRVEYEYSTDDTNWTKLTIANYTTSPIANKQATFSLAEGTTHIRFRITLKKRVSTAQSPKFNSIRFRYRKFKTLHEIDPRFNINIPSFLAAREQETRSIEATDKGWVMKFPLNWWILPEADLLNVDVITFLQGYYAGYRFETKNVRAFTYGADMQILHKGFESVFIRDEHELVGIIHYLI